MRFSRSFVARLMMLVPLAGPFGCRPAPPETPASASKTSPPESAAAAPAIIDKQQAAPSAPPKKTAQDGPSLPAKVVAERPKGQKLFTEVTSQWGLPEKPWSWPDGRYLTPEITAGGVAVFDYDNDGRLDIYQICHPPPGEYPAAFEVAAPNRLYHQKADGTFEDVSEKSGLADSGFGMGVAVGDMDNDGFVDVYVTNFGRNRFYHNNGDGTFSEATQRAGLANEPAWNSSAVFVDYDRDGFLDLLVVRFARFDPKLKCAGPDGADNYCGPHKFQGIRDVLYHNNGDGTFTDVTEKSGFDKQLARGWGAAVVDANRDGWPDLYVANDEEPAQLWINQRDGTFVDEAMLRNCGVNGAGGNEAGMGVAIGDTTGQGKLDLFVTHITGEKNTLYRSDGLGMFSDDSFKTGLAAPSIPFTGWGCAFVDYDHRGSLGLAVVNGRVDRHAEMPGVALSPFWNGLGESNQLFANDGKGNFTDVSAKAGDFGRRIELHRGLAVGDLDGDGDLDLVTNGIGNVLHVYRNDAPPSDSHWLIVRAMTGRRDAYGAEVTVHIGGKKLLRLADPGYSFLSSCDPRAHFGLGAAETIDRIEVRWPGGRRETFSGTPVDRVITLLEGKGVSHE